MYQILMTGSARRRRTLGLALGALLGGCALADPRPAPWIDALEFPGAERVAADEVAGHLRTARPGRWPWSAKVPLDAALLEEDVERVGDLYRQRGYYSTRVRTRVDWNAARDRARVRIEIEEGLPVLVQTRTIEIVPRPDGLSPEQITALSAGLAGGPGEVFDLRDYLKAKEQLVRRLADAGYLTAAVRGGADVDVERQTSSIAWTVDPGPLVLLGEVGIHGLEHVDPELLQDEVGGARGSPLPLRWLEDTQRKLAGLGWFHSVTVRPLPTAAAALGPRVQTWPVLVEVDERPPRTIQAALGYSTEEQVRARVGWEHRQLLGGGRTLRLGARASGLETRAEGAIGWPKFFSPHTTAELRLDAARETLEAYDAQTFGFKFEVRHDFAPRAQLRFGHRFEHSRTSDVSRAAESILDDPRQSALVSLSHLELERADIDDPLDPARGTLGRVGFQLASALLGSSVDYLGGDLELRYYRPWRSAVFATRLRMASLLPFRTTQPEDVPLTERLFAGGSETVRGYELQRLGPLDADDEPVGGTSLLVANLELRVPIRGKLSGVAFVDGGLVELDPLHFPLGSMRYSSGVGLRFDTPVGPLRLDVGFLLNRPDDEDRMRVHLSVGQAF
jgi:outer membrane protein insertion porin family/translocation and assembly module TamA